jgi:hypothetical protein
MERDMAEEAEFLSGTDVNTALVVVHGVGLRAFQYVDIDGRARVEGCIDLGATAEVELQTKELRKNPQAAKNNLEVFGAGIKEIRFRWKNKTVPFTVDAGLPNSKRVDDAIAHWHAKTMIRFVKRTNEPDFVTFRAGSGCSSSVGRQGGQQFVTLGEECTTGNCIHEIGHTLGLWHEQSRIDRDLFIHINFQNIIPGMEHNFFQHVHDGIDLGNYDYGSVMHYPATAFSKNGQPTVVTPGGQAIGQRTGLSSADIASIKLLYP